MRLRSLAAAIGVIAGVAAICGPAWAHGDLRKAKPEAGRHLRKPPQVIELDFAEPPTADSEFEVKDGCRDNVLGQVSGEGPNAVLGVDGGAPGRWTVSYRVISSVDGHLVRGSYSFHVGNKKPCEPVASPTLAAPADGDDGDEGGFPATPVLIGGAAVFALALGIRLISAR